MKLIERISLLLLLVCVLSAGCINESSNNTQPNQNFHLDGSVGTTLWIIDVPEHKNPTKRTENKEV